MGTQRQNLSYLEVPLVESGRIYKPASLARRIVNFEPTPEGTLQTMRGPVPYEIRSQTNLGRILGIYHSSTLGGANDLLLVRAGSVLYRHAGWKREWDVIRTGINDEDRQKYPDSFAEINGRVIWSNGTARPLVINSSRYYGSHSYPLGFERAPSCPSVLYPDTSELETTDTPPNYAGYSFHGRIGTVGDTYAGQQGNLLAGTWLYAVCMEDYDGNLSPLSTPVAAYLKAQATTYDNALDPGADFWHNKLDDLTRSFYVQGIDPGPEHTAYTRVYRTPDSRHGPADFHLLARLPGRRGCPYPDNTPDGFLVAAPLAEDVISVPHYKIACEYQGRLCVANTLASPGEIKFSQPNFPGTFHRQDYIIPDSSGAEITGLISLGRSLLAMTARSTYVVTLDAEGIRSEPLSKTIGCVGPGTVVGLEDGSVMWLGRDGFYRFDGKNISRTSDQITPLILSLNQGRVGRSVAYYDPTTSEYRCAVPVGTCVTNDRWLCYDRQREGWRELEYNLHCGAVAVTNDDRRYPMAGLYDPSGDGSWDVFVLGHESRVYDPPSRRYLYSSSEIRLGRDQTGLQKFSVDRFLIGFVESAATSEVSVLIYKNGRNDDPVTTACKLVDPDFGSTWSYGTAVLGTDIFRDPKICWARVDCDITDVSSFRFELSALVASTGFRMELHGIAFLGGPVEGKGNHTPMSTWDAAP